jgi:hypothetical protein
MWSKVVVSGVVWTIDGNYEAAGRWNPVVRPVRHLIFFVSFLAMKAVRNC